MKKIIQTDKAPQAIGPYSQAIQVGNLIFLSGQIPLVPETMALVSTEFREQAIQVFTNLQAMCQAVGADVNAIVKLTIYLTDLTDFAVVNEVMQHFFSDPYPARVTLQVAALPKGASIEVDGIIAV